MDFPEQQQALADQAVRAADVAVATERKLLRDKLAKLILEAYLAGRDEAADALRKFYQEIQP